MRAVTIRVNDVEGVGGFVLPGDRVDVSLTRQGDRTASTTDVVLQSVKVLAIDQTADERADKPAIARSVTLEVDVNSAQKLALASSGGTLSLMLRRAGEAGSEQARRVTMGDLLGTSAPAAAPESKFATIGVRRGSKRDDVSVPMEEYSTVGAAVRGHGQR
jgi:pilus assembly protein CpaB